MNSRALVVAVLLCSCAALAQKGASELERAQRLMFDQKWAEADKALTAALASPGNARETVLKIYESRGVVAAQKGDPESAVEAFGKLLALNPEFAPTGTWAGRVQKAFSAAKDKKVAIDFTAAAPSVEPSGVISQLAAKVSKDSFKLGKKVRFHLKAEGASQWQVQDAELQGKYGALATDSAAAVGFLWWAELLGDADGVLLVLGSETEPQKAGRVSAPAVVASVPALSKPPPDAPVAADPVAPVVDTTEPGLDTTAGHQSSALRPVGYVLAGAGVVAAGVGVVFALQSKAARGQVENAKPDADGVIRTLKQTDAIALEADANSKALLANVMFAAGGALVVSGAVCWLLGGSSSSSSVAVAPIPGGAAVSLGGSF